VYAFASLVYFLAQILTFAIFLRAILSWFPSPTTIPIIRVLDIVTEPILAPLRRVVPTIGMMDITPLVAIILIQFIAQAIISAL
jgi:YggT family protein